MKHFKLFTLCLIAMFFTITVSAQNRKVSINVKNEPVGEVMKQIEQQSGYSFFYSDDLVDIHRRVTINAVNKDVLALVNEIFKSDNLTSSIIEGNIVLSKKDASQQKSSKVQGPGKKKYNGNVKDETGQPVVGATVISMNDNTVAATTDVNGNFSIDANNGDNLEISCLGFTSLKFNVGPDTQNKNFTMKEDFQQLEEIIVVGYGTQKRSDVTGAISSVAAEKLNKTPTNSIGEMLRGAAAGVQVNLNSAAPGGSSSVLIRGRRSLSASNSPLYIVDGVPITSIDDINASDISSMEILKDASSQSIYGARAANGVILITTKRGQKGQTQISYSGYMAAQDISRNFEFYNGEEWAAYRKEAYLNAYGYYDEDDCLKGFMKDVYYSGEWVDWEKLMIHTAFQQKHDLLVQSGNEKTKFALGLGAYTQDGMVIKSGFQKVSGRLNIDHKLTKDISVGANLTFSRSWTQSADGSFNTFVTMPPLAKVYEDDGVTLRKDVTEAGESHFNPLWNINNSDDDTTTDRYLINIFGDWNIFKNFNYHLNASMNVRDVEDRSYLGLKHTTGMNTSGKATATNSKNYDYLIENIFNYTKKFNSYHSLDVTLMQSINEITWKAMGFTGTGFSNDDLTYNAIGSALEYGVPTYQLSERRMVSFLGRARYNFKDRYLFTAALRVDGSSVFGRNNKYGYFPSASFAWRMNDEKFLKNVHWLSNLKLRLSYGQVGNQGVSPYTTLGLTEKYMYEFGNQVTVGYLPNATLSNPNLKWETSTSANLGVDFGFFKGRIGGTVETYDTQTRDLLIYKSLSQSTGYTNQLVNLGQVQNRGVEITLDLIPVKTKSFEWGVDMTYAKNVNKIIKIDGSLDDQGNPANDVNNNWFIGQPMNVYYDYKFDGIWQTGDDIANSYMPDAKPGYIKIQNTDNSDNAITDKDKVIMKRDPDWIGTLGTSLSYMGFDLAADLYVSYGGTKYNPYLTTFADGGDMTGKRNGIRRNYWTTHNPSQEAPSPNMIQAPAYITSLGYQNASFVRLRNITFGYTFPTSLVKKISLKSLRLYTTFTNIWTYTKVLGYGPEQTPGDYPEPRTMLFGVNVTL
jgi:TonB-linked SusC/RagA family outer membrane protein